jgi:succinate dehydrogenase / fumarate reductase membrane anchor subunit
MSNSLRTTLGRVRGSGSAKEGVAHWWAQRMTAMALVPLMLWFVAWVVALAGADRAAVVAWLGAPWNATLMILLIGATFHHAQLGLQVVIEDYVHQELVKTISIALVRGAALLLGLGSAVAVLRIAVGG